VAVVQRVFRILLASISLLPYLYPMCLSVHWLFFHDANQLPVLIAVSGVFDASIFLYYHFEQAIATDFNHSGSGGRDYFREGRNPSE